MFNQSSGCVHTEKANVCWQQTTVVNSQDHVYINVSVVYVQQLTDNSTSSSKRAINTYAIVFNTQSQVIGQLVSDAIHVDAAGNNAGTTIFDGDFQLCIPPNQNIPIDSFFTMKDFAWKATTTDNFVAQGTTVTIDSDGNWCANVRKSGIYVATMTSSNVYTNGPTLTSTSVSTGHNNAFSLMVSIVCLLFVVLMI